MRIGICDDELSVRNLIEKYVSEIFLDVKCIQFSSGEELLAYMNSKQDLDILLLDIAMPEIDGMDVANRIVRDICESNHSVRIARPFIIFVTGDETRMLEAFRASAFDYILKPISANQLRETLESAKVELDKLESLRDNNNIPITIKNGGNTYSIDSDEILYIESNGRKVVIHTRNGQVESYGKIGDWEQSLGQGFYRTHKSYIVNMKHIKKFTRGEVLLADEQQALLSKYRYNDFVQRYMNYIADREN